MGLDMYGCTLRYNPDMLVGPCEVEVSLDDLKEFFYWRKHYDLHEWMELLNLEKGGAGDEFASLVLTIGDLNRLEKDIRADALPRSWRGDFRGSEAMRRDLEFVRKARDEMKKGLFVVYVASY